MPTSDELMEIELNYLTLVRSEITNPFQELLCEHHLDRGYYVECIVGKVNEERSAYYQITYNIYCYRPRFGLIVLGLWIFGRVSELAATLIWLPHRKNAQLILHRPWLEKDELLPGLTRILDQASRCKTLGLGPIAIRPCYQTNK